jgi:hypothetical protein
LIHLPDPEFLRLKDPVRMLRHDKRGAREPVGVVGEVILVGKPGCRQEDQNRDADRASEQQSQDLVG